VSGLRERLCFELSRRLIEPPDTRTRDMTGYVAWRNDSLARSWARFDDRHVVGKDVLDFGSGKGSLTFFLAQKGPRRIVGLDLHGPSLEVCREEARRLTLPAGTALEFVQGGVAGMPLPDASFDTLTAFDCVEHVMDPAAIFREWHRVLRPGGRALIEWFPFRGPWGPHMESLVPIPWAHVVFGERAMFRAAERIYDLPEYAPRPWDLDEHGQRLPNKWRAWSTFAEQGYVNELDVATFRREAEACGFAIDRFEAHGFSSSAAKRLLGDALMRVPGLGEYFTSYVLVELVRR
jgi:SAM-dependent methyltransferase